MPADHAAKTAELADVRPIVDRLLLDAVDRGASDVHVEPTAQGYEIRLRIDGLLEFTARHDQATGRAMVSRLMVMAGLLTYRLDIPQEGRFALAPKTGADPVDLRLAVMPTTHGLKAAVRLPADLRQPTSLDQLQLPTPVVDGLKTFAAGDTGMLIVAGPAGSGKTTTVYSLLRHIAHNAPGLSIVSLEDPVERDLPGVTQIEVSPFGQLTYDRALRSILRQDPQVLMLGEIRDAATATLALQAALSGHRLVCTFHASTAAGAIARLVEMGAEPHQIAAAVFGVVSQRLLRKITPAGYRGRTPVAELAVLDGRAREAIVRREQGAVLDVLLAERTGFRSIRQVAGDLVAAGVTDAAEVARVLGPGGSENR
jgi:type II secretory ATPase GspE/PulE/Tfp pilus assembly ATPase PilB-like protein